MQKKRPTAAKVAPAFATTPTTVTASRMSTPATVPAPPLVCAAIRVPRGLSARPACASSPRAAVDPGSGAPRSARDGDAQSRGSFADQRRIRDACPHATEVCTFHGWLKAGRCVMKRQEGIRIVAPDTIDEGKVTSIKPVYVFDVTQPQELPRRAA